MWLHAPDFVVMQYTTIAYVGMHMHANQPNQDVTVKPCVLDHNDLTQQSLLLLLLLL